MAIHLRSAEELEKMHRAGLFVHEILTALRSAVKPGMFGTEIHKRGVPIVFGVTAFSTSAFAQTVAEIIERTASCGATTQSAGQSAGLATPPR